MGIGESKGNHHLTPEHKEKAESSDSVGGSTVSNSTVLSKKGGVNGNIEPDPNSQTNNIIASDIRSKYLNRLKINPTGKILPTSGSVIQKPISGGEAIRTSKLGQSDGSLPMYKSSSIDESEKKMARSPFDITEEHLG